MNECIYLHVFYRAVVVEKELFAFLQTCSVAACHTVLDGYEVIGLP